MNQKLTKVAATAALAAALAGCQTIGGGATLSFPGGGPEAPERPLLERDGVAEMRATVPERPDAITKRYGLSGSTVNINGNDAAVTQPTVERELRRILSRIEAAWGPNGPDIDLQLTSGQSYHASATGAWEIRVNAGIIENAEHEDEVAAVLAHEYAHVVLRHFDRLDAEDARSEVMDGLFKAGMALATASQILGEDSELGQGVALAALAANQVAETVVEPAWTRTQEDEADLLAIDLMAKAGYRPDALFDVLERIHNQSEQGDAVARRIADAMRPRFQMLKDGSVRVSVDVGGAVRQMAGALLDKLREEHSSPMARRDDAQSYILAHHDDGAFLQPPMKPLRIKTDPDVQAFLTRQRDAHDALTNFVQGDYIKAESLAQKVITREPRHPKARLTLARLAANVGDADRSLRHLMIAQRHPDVAPGILTALAKAHVYGGHYDLASDALDRMDEKFGSPRDVLPLRAWVHANAGSAADVSRILEACETTEFDELIDRCYTHAGRQRNKSIFDTFPGASDIDIL